MSTVLRIKKRAYIAMMLAISACDKARDEPLPPSPTLNETSISDRAEGGLNDKQKSEFSTPRDAISAYLDLKIDSETDFTITSDKAVENWRFICGDIDLSKSENVELNSQNRTFCTLVEESSSNFKVTEFEIVGFDAPWLDWIEKYGLPERILD